MLKFTHFASMALVSLSFSVQAQSITLPYTDNFDYLEKGTSINSNSASTTAKSGDIKNCLTATKLYQAGGKLKFGASKDAGVFTTVEINPEDAENITVEFDAISWVGKTSDIEITYGTQTEKVTIAAGKEWPIVQENLAKYSVTFKAEADKTLSFKSGISGEKRIFLDNLSVYNPVAAGIENNLSSSVSAVGAKGMIIVDSNENETIEVYNFAGKLVTSESISTGHNEIKIEQGLYIVNINGDVTKVAVQ